MGQLSAKFRSIEDGGLGYWCQGCEMLHQIHHGTGSGPRWQWNGSLDAPTFHPSVLVSWSEAGVPKVCHTFITNGVVRFLDDCTHPLAGQTLPLPDLPPEWCDEG